LANRILYENQNFTVIMRSLDTGRRRVSFENGLGGGGSLK
jgi:hypothetical protein